ncbi:hypothetical protein VTO42DRAFT_5090 [Malbranchea cinnamomea]
MFSWTGGLGIPSLTIDTTRERAPPPPATPLDFPNYPRADSVSSEPLTEESCNKLYQLLSKLRRPQDVNESYLQALNIRVETDVKLPDIVPGGKLASLPPYQWPEGLEDQDSSAGGSAVLSNGFPIPKQEKYDLLRQEVLFDNDDAFRAVSRMDPLPGRPRIRVTHSRRFWAGLEHLAQYWDSSLDKYIEKPADESSSEGEKDEKNQDKMDVDEAHQASNNSCKDYSSEKMDVDGEPKNEDERGKPPKTKQVYLGRRIGTGKDMPESVREDTLRGLLEMVAWSFGCQLHIPNLPPRLFVKGLLFPVRHSFSICRSPQDRQEARRGMMEGPLILVQCRGETSFHDKETGAVDKSAEICDILRETVGMLLLAQERARQDETEVKPGEGKWWATEPRWGGAPNDGPVVEPEVGDRTDSSGKGAGGNEEADRSAKRSRHSRRFLSQRKLSTVERWKIVQPGPSTWDKKLKYMRIGKDEDSPFDDIFMVSSLNHHFAVLHLRVHPSYLSWLATGKPQSVEASDTSGQPWHSLIVRRTRWFDLLKPEDRAEGLEGLWALFSWLMRS